MTRTNSKYHRRKRRRSALRGIVLAIAAPCTLTAQGQVTFTEVGAARGIGPYEAGPGFGSGVAVADYDDDGDLDIFVPNGPGVANQLYRNLGDGSYEEIAADVGVAEAAAGRTALFLDYDGDGRLDLVVAGDCRQVEDSCMLETTIHFYRQRADGTFDDLTSVIAVADDGIVNTGQHRAGMVAGDLNNDQWPDIIVGIWTGPALVLLNDGGKGFIDASVATGIADATFHHWQPAIHDFDGDGWADIYWAADFTENHFWRNQRDGTFVDLAPLLGLDNAMNDMGMTLGDYDNDGDLDIYITEIFEFDNHNVLYRNDTVNGALAFTEVATASGVDNTNFGWGTTFLDVDNDGWLDLAATNGYFNGQGYDDPSRLFYNLGTDPVVFVDLAPQMGFDDREWGASLVAFDLERDGDLDVLQTCNQGGPLRLLENEPGPVAAENHHLVVRPRTSGPNTRAIGAIVRIEAGGRNLMRLVTAGTSHLGQEPAEAFFGVGTAETVDRVVVSWPDGAQTILSNVAADQVLTVERSACAGTVDLDGDGTVGFADLLILLSGWGPCPVRCPQDIDGNGGAGFEDVIALLSAWGACP